MNRYSLCLLWFWLCIPATALSAQVQRDEAKTLIVTTWGGAYEAAQRQAYFAPFAQEAGVSKSA